MLGRNFELRIDHMRLNCLFGQLNLNLRQAGWMELLCEIDFQIKHVKGKENKVTDALSIEFCHIHQHLRGRS